MKTVNKTMTNDEIYNYAVKLNNDFGEENQIYFPAAINFCIQKNKNTLMTIATDLEKARIDILQHYGEYNSENGSFSVPQENIDTANKELSALLSIEQEVKIYIGSIEDLNNVELTSSQMESLLFMIED